MVDEVVMVMLRFGMHRRLGLSVPDMMDFVDNHLLYMNDFNMMAMVTMMTMGRLSSGCKNQA